MIVHSMGLQKKGKKRGKKVCFREMAERTNTADATSVKKSRIDQGGSGTYPVKGGGGAGHWSFSGALIMKHN